MRRLRFRLALALSAALPALAGAPALASPKSAPATAMAAPDYTGVGPLRFGMTAEQMRAAWGAPLHADTAQDGMACHYLSPTGKIANALMFMVDQGRFGRVDVQFDPAIVAPGGGHIGMDVAQLRKLYAGRVTSTPNKYDAAASVLKVASPPGVAAQLVFDADAHGKVVDWRIGVAPQVDYVEGCG